MSELILSITIETLEEGGYLATSDDLQGLIAQGRTMAETIEIAQDVARKLIESYVEHDDPLPSRIAEAVRRPQRRTRTKIPVGFSFDPSPA
jgi:predicted RNase H-like HicB family nuclease